MIFCNNCEVATTSVMTSLAETMTIPNIETTTVPIQRDRKPVAKRKSFDNEQLQAIKTLLTGIADSQEALLLAAERQADAHERIALSLEVISERLSGVSRETSSKMPQDAPDLSSR